MKSTGDATMTTNATLTIELPQRTIYNGSIISLRGDSGNYMSRMGPENLELSKGEIDEFCKFTVQLSQTGNDVMLALQGDTRKWMSRQGPADLLLSKDKVDEFCLFKYSVDSKNGLIALQGDTGMYLSRWGPKDLKLGKDQVDRYCQFIVVIHS
jgi:hypothetical protein